MYRYKTSLYRYIRALYRYIACLYRYKTVQNAIFWIFTQYVSIHTRLVSIHSRKILFFSFSKVAGFLPNRSESRLNRIISPKQTHTRNHQIPTNNLEHINDISTTFDFSIKFRPLKNQNFRTSPNRIKFTLYYGLTILDTTKQFILISVRENIGF